MSRYNKRSHLNNGAICLVASALLGIGVILICLMGFAMILSRLNASGIVLSVLATVSLCIGGYFGGYVCARKKRRNGLLQGVICGMIIFMIILFFGALFAKAALGISTGGKLLLTMLFSGIGGIVGVNTKKRRY